MSSLRGIADLGAVPDESDDQRAQRRALVVAIFVGTCLAALFTVLAALNGEVVPAKVNAGGTLVLLALLAWFAWSKHFTGFVIAVACFVIFLPCLALLLFGSLTDDGNLLIVAALGPTIAAVCLPRRVAFALLGLSILLTFATVAKIGRPMPIMPKTPETLMGYSAAVNNTVVAGFLVFLVSHLVKKRRDAMVALEAEHQRSEALLLNVLPPSIAERLKSNPGVIADQHESATILFADVVGFTPLSAELPAARLISVLNDLFSRFDALTEKHGLEKIKTIGDAYLVVGGLPTARPDHAEAVAAMALDMIETMRSFREEQGLPIDVRIGLNSGPVIAGVIGQKKFIYDLWGDAVNVAARMESHGTAGAIHVAPGAHTLLEAKFVLEARGTMQIKGKGEMATWMLLGRRAANP